MRGLAIERRQDVATAGQQQTVDGRDHVIGPIDRAVEHTDLAAGASDRFLVVGKLVARWNSDMALRIHFGTHATFFAERRFP